VGRGFESCRTPFSFCFWVLNDRIGLLNDQGDPSIPPRDPHRVEVLLKHLRGQQPHPLRQARPSAVSPPPSEYLMTPAQTRQQRQLRRRAERDQADKDLRPSISVARRLRIIRSRARSRAAACTPMAPRSCTTTRGMQATLLRRSPRENSSSSATTSASSPRSLMSTYGASISQSTATRS
jgi:hypothetical protein